MGFERVCQPGDFAVLEGGMNRAVFPIVEKSVESVHNYL